MLITYQVRFPLPGWRKVRVGFCYFSPLVGVISVEPAGCCINAHKSIHRKSPLPFSSGRHCICFPIPLCLCVRKAWTRHDKYPVWQYPSNHPVSVPNQTPFSWSKAHQILQLALCSNQILCSSCWRSHWLTNGVLHIFQTQAGKSEKAELRRSQHYMNSPFD